MSTMRGLIPSLGAGASLIAAALCALAVFGGLLAFRGDSRGAAAASSGELTLSAGKVRARTDPAPARRAARTARANVTVLAAARPPARRAARAVLRTWAPQAPAVTPAVTAPPGAVAPVTAPPRAAPPPPSPVTAAGEPARDLPVVDRSAAPPSGTVRRAVTQTRALAQPVVDAAPAPVREPVEQVAAMVDDVPRALLP